MRRDERALFLILMLSSRLRELAHVHPWVWPCALAALMVLTSTALAFLVTAWLVPPYLALVAWILFPTSKQRSDGLVLLGQSRPPHQVLEGISDELSEQADDTVTPECSDEPNTEAESLADEAESTEQVALKNRRGRARSRKAKGFVEPPAAVTWVQVRPGKFVRVEPASPMVAHFSQAPTAEPANGAVLADSSSAREGTEAYPLAPCADAAQAADEVPLSVEELESSPEAGLVVTADPEPVCVEAMPPGAPELVDAAQPVESEVSGCHPDEPQEVDRVAEIVTGGLANTDSAAEVVESTVEPANWIDDTQVSADEELEKRGIAPEASGSEPTADCDVGHSENATHDIRPEEGSGTPNEVPAEWTDRPFPAFFRDSWLPSLAASRLFANASPLRRDVRDGRSGRLAPGFRQRSRRSAGRLRQPCRAFPPRAPPCCLDRTAGRPSSHWKDVPRPVVSNTRARCTAWYECRTATRIDDLNSS